VFLLLLAHILHAISPDDIKVKEPGGQEPGKTHTSLLLDKHGDFLAFGSKAREDYYGEYLSVSD